jgi:D-alanyl-D-alanine carboxypeptidase
MFGLWLTTACGQPSDPAPAGDVIAQQPDAVNAELMALLEQYVFDDEPGVVLLVGNREESYLAAYGLADLNAGTPIQTDDYFRIASTSKPMVSTALLTFVETGDIALDDPIADYLPDDIANNLANADSATVRQMLQMTSGIPDYLATDAFLDAVDDAPQTFWRPEQVLEFAYGEPASFDPGDDYEYSNSNYILAEIIIQELSGRSLAEVLETTVFTPAGMDDCYFETADTFAQNIVRGYDVDDDDELEDVTEINDGVGLGDGGVVCTAESLARFLPALMDGDLLGDDVLEEMLTAVPSGEGAPYGLGIDVDRDGEFGFSVGHDGVSSGFQAGLIYFVEDDLVVVALTNFVESDILEDVASEALEWWFE